MSSKEVSFCKLCNMSFYSEEEFSLHSCIEIKQEIQDLKGYQSDLDLSEEFISVIRKQVDVLCYIINNGDSNLKRTQKVNESLNNAITCYKIHANTKELIEDNLNDDTKEIDKPNDDSGG